MSFVIYHLSMEWRLILIFRKRKSSKTIDPHNTDDIADERSSKKSFRKKLVDQFSAFKVDDHRRAERRIIFIGLFSFLLVVGVVGGFYKSHVYSVEQSEKVSVSNDSIQFSKTGATVTLGKLVRSKDRTRIVVPFTISDMSNLSASANDYSVFVESTSSSTPLSYKPSGRLILFGTEAGLGRGAIVLTDKEHKLQNQSIYIMLRNNKNITVDANGQTENDVSNDTTLKQVTSAFDVAIMSINAGTSSVKESSELSSTAIRPSNIYNVGFGAKDEVGIKKEIASTKSSLKKYVARVKADRSKLSNLGLKVPADPDFMKDSYVPRADASGSSPANLPTDSDLKMKNGQSWTDYQNKQDSASNNAAVNSASSSTTQNADISSIWSDLQTSWQGVYANKVAIYNTYDVQLKAVETAIRAQDTHANVSGAKHFRVIGAVKTSN